MCRGVSVVFTCVNDSQPVNLEDRRPFVQKQASSRLVVANESHPLAALCAFINTGVQRRLAAMAEVRGVPSAHAPYP
ncbi:unnamed protein product [Leptosia nina]|uniref:Uncharacterized protein n=1 Tax=Leptosia nina TaxID=320188 RepID=A0AAV1J7K1_9NEOP